jgi:serine/threonine protein kinase
MDEDLIPTVRMAMSTVVESSARPPSPPSYELMEEIGRGGMGVVYRARDTALDHDVAVKLLSERYPAVSALARVKLKLPAGHGRKASYTAAGHRIR